jgi:hypothetical protein
MKHPLSHLDDCDGCKYGIQLGVYAWILEKYYNKQVRGLALCSLHPEAPYHTWVPYLKDEIDYLMRKRREKVAAKMRANIDAGNLFPRCHACGKLPFDAVRYNEQIYSEKVLLVIDEDAKYEIHQELRDALELFLATIHPTRPTSREEEKISDALPWKSRIPAQGCSKLVSAEMDAIF